MDAADIGIDYLSSTHCPRNNQLHGRVTETNASIRTCRNENPAGSERVQRDSYLKSR